MKALNASSKMNADWDFFQYLKNIGYNAADFWLKNNWSDVGKKSTIDIHDKFLCGSGNKHHNHSQPNLENFSKKRAKADNKQQA